MIGGQSYPESTQWADGVCNRVRSAPALPELVRRDGPSLVREHVSAAGGGCGRESGEKGCDCECGLHCE